MDSFTPPAPEPDPPSAPKWVVDLPQPPIRLVTLGGAVLFEGSLETFWWNYCILQYIFTNEGFDFGKYLYQSHTKKPDMHPIYLVGTTRVKTVKDLCNVIDWTQQDLTFTVVFQPGFFHDKTLEFSHDRWFEANGVMRAFRGFTEENTCIFAYVHKNTIPESWEPNENGIWVPPFKAF